MVTVNRIIIIGGGIAGVTAAEAARTRSPDTDIVLIHDEPGLPYNRLNLTRMIAGEIEPGKLEINDIAWYLDNRIKHIHDLVISIHPEKKFILMRNQDEMAYGQLIIATGANPFIPPIPGANLECAFTLRTLTHAREILDKVREGMKCICIGGGLLGLELAVGLKKQGADVTILERSDWLLSRQLAPPASAILKKHLTDMGLSVLCGIKVIEIIGENKVTGVAFEGGGSLEAEMVLISIGVRPNIEMAAIAGLAVGKGITVDDRMATSKSSIYAAGDVTEHNGVTYGLWPIAMEQGRVAGANATGGSEVFKGVSPPTFLKVVGVSTYSIGKFMPEDESTIIYEIEEGTNYSRLAIRDGKVIGCNLLGNIRAAQLVKRAIESQSPVGENLKLLEKFPGLQDAIQG